MSTSERVPLYLSLIITLCAANDTVIQLTDTTPDIIQPFTNALSTFSSYCNPFNADDAESS